MADKNTWKEYYKRVKNKPHSSLLEIALRENKHKKARAYDLGCGGGVDSAYLLKKGWSVTAVDREPEFVEFMREHVSRSKKLRPKICSFEKIKLEKCQLINGTFSFPFCHPRHFNSLWKKMRDALAPGGTICGQLFGVNDSWAINRKMSFHSERNWNHLLKGYDVLLFDEVEFDGETSRGDKKHWHLYFFVLVKQ